MGQEDSAAYQLESAYWKYWDMYWEAPMAVYTKAKRLEAWAKQQGDCDSMEVAQTLLLSYDNRESAKEPLDSVLKMPVWCDTTMHSLWYAIGVRHFVRQEFEEAYAGFLRAEALAIGASQRVTSMHALGTVRSSMGDRKGAYAHFLRAYQADSSLSNPVFLNNLGVMTLYLEQYDDAAGWLNKAWASWPEWVDDTKMPEHFDQTILTNLLLLSCQIGDKAAAAEWFAQVNPKFLSDQDPLSGVGTLVAYLLWIDDQYTWEVLRPILSQHVIVQPDASRDLLQEVAWLFPEIWPEDRKRPDWAEIRSVAPAFRLHHFPDQPLVEVIRLRDAAEAERKSRLTQARWVQSGIWGVFAVAFCLACFWTLRGARRRTNVNPEVFENVHNAIDVLERSLTEPDVKWEAALTRVRADLASLEHENPHMEAQLEGLTNREREVFELTLDGMRPKEIAQVLACNPSYVYNLRTNIRKKLGFQSDEDMVSSWLAAKSRRKA